MGANTKELNRIRRRLRLSEIIYTFSVTLIYVSLIGSVICFIALLCEIFYNFWWIWGIAIGITALLIALRIELWQGEITRKYYNDLKGQGIKCMQGLENLEKQKEEERRIEEAKATEEILKLVYQKCNANDIHSLDGEQNSANAVIIARGFGLTGEDKEILTALRVQFEKEERALKEKELEKERDKQKELQREYSIEKKKAYISGKYKYMLALVNKATEYYRKLNELEGDVKQTRKALETTSPTKPAKKIDPYIAGGIAQGIAGPAAGLFAAMNAERWNQQNQQTYGLAEVRADIIRSSSALIEITQDFLKPLEKALEKVQNAMYDESNPADKFDRIEFTKISIDSIFRFGMELTVETAVSSEYYIVETPAKIDGSVRIVILDEGQPIGDAYFNAYGFGDVNLSNVGFSANPKRCHYENHTVKALPYVGCEFSADKVYSFRIEPICIWAIECVDNNYWAGLKDASYNSIIKRTWKSTRLDYYTKSLIRSLPDVQTEKVLDIPPRYIENNTNNRR